MTLGPKLGTLTAAAVLTPVLAVGLAWALACGVGAATAAQPIPLQAGTYCGPGDARIVVDVAHDRVEIDHMVCSYPVIAADHMQSDLCSTPEGQSVARNFDFRVIGREFWHVGQVYRICGTVPADPSKPLSAAPPKAGG